MKKILLAILGSFILLSTVTFGCPNKGLHNTVTKYLGISDAIHVEEGRLFIANEAFATEVYLASNEDMKKSKKVIDTIFKLLFEYSEYHDLEIIVLNDIKGWIK